MLLDRRKLKAARHWKALRNGKWLQDEALNLINPIIRALVCTLRIHHHLSTPYYPQSNRKIERVVGTIKAMLKRAVMEAQQQPQGERERERKGERERERKGERERELKQGKEELAEVERFELGQRVWKRESQYDAKGFVPVFAPRWTGPFEVHSVFEKNAYKLRTVPEVTGKRIGYLRNPVNGARLRRYVDGEVVN
ncbi:hypothetical protein BGX38DRAFT_261913 [Terfezia claveryi]|nr:hypothetical protein BGX38DRAFT_261913 [Terfezia claveryi]